MRIVENLNLRIHFCCIFLFLPLLSFSQFLDSAISADLTVQFKPYIPKGLYVIDTASFDFNNDNLPDIVLVLDSAHYISDDERSNRALLILEYKNNAYTVSAFCKNAILCQSCGGAFGEPYAGISCKKNVLEINHYGGSADRFFMHTTFRFQHHQWELIGISNGSFYCCNDCGNSIGQAGENLQEINFSTGKVHIIETKDRGCKPEKDIWKLFKRMKIIILSEYNIDTEYINELKY